MAFIRSQSGDNHNHSQLTYMYNMKMHMGLACIYCNEKGLPHVTLNFLAQLYQPKSRWKNKTLGPFTLPLSFELIKAAPEYAGNPWAHQVHVHTAGTSVHRIAAAAQGASLGHHLSLCHHLQLKLARYACIYCERNTCHNPDQQHDVKYHLCARFYINDGK